MVGVVKQKKKATGEIIEYTIEMGRKLVGGMLSCAAVGRGGMMRKMDAP